MSRYGKAGNRRGKCMMRRRGADLLNVSVTPDFLKSIDDAHVRGMTPRAKVDPMPAMGPPRPRPGYKGRIGRLEHAITNRPTYGGPLPRGHPK
eukprot:2714610-Pyramimonas_sp.AAC.1